MEIEEKKHKIEEENKHQVEEQIIEKPVEKIEKGKENGDNFVDVKKKRKAEETRTIGKDSPKRQKQWGISNNSTLTAPAVSTDTLKNILPETAVQTKKKQVETPISTNKIPKVEENKSQEPEKRFVPPSRRPPSTVVFIRGFVRPFTKQAAKDLLDQSGQVIEWGMDAIKSRCHVIYATKEQAIAARDAIHNLTWPPNNKAQLYADFSTEEEARRFYKNNSGEEKRVRSPPRRPVIEKPAATLDELFKKTQAKPPIYYLPLSEKEVEAKKRLHINNDLIDIQPSKNNTEGSKVIRQ